MSLYSTLTSSLSETRLAELAQASMLPVSEVQPRYATAAAALVRQLALPTDLDELNARWDMCRQLYVSEVLTNSQELLRTDLGWPERRRYLAEKLLGLEQLAELGAATAQSAPARLLGFVTVLALATAGQEADHQQLDPAALGEWLRQQQVPAAADKATAKPATTSARPTAAPARKATPAPAAQPVLASSSRLRMAGIGAAVALLVGVGAYYSTASPTAAPARPQETQPVAVAAPVAAEVAAPVVASQPQAAPVAPLVVAQAKAKPTGPVLRDTVGNAEIARNIGGRFDVAAGRYTKGESQPLTIKLVEKATLSVGVNSTESLLYKRLASPALPVASDLAIDRLSFATSEARLGAEGAQQLGSIAALLKTFPKARLLVVGHANLSEGNMTQLALQRAQAAVDELRKRGIAAERLQAQGVMATGTPHDDDSPERQASLQGITLKIGRL